MTLTREHKKSLTDRVYFPSEETLKLAQRNVHFTHLKKKKRERKEKWEERKEGEKNYLATLGTQVSYKEN